MAIIQISKIQQRSGNLVDLPQLDEAQLGWANDAKRLFIGTTTPNPVENVEVLTAYSNISFSQIDGSGAYGNLDISITNSNIAANSIGEVLAFDGTNWVNAGGNTGGEINLGNVANITIGGGAIGYVLETDGLGNLSWTPKGTILANIANLTRDTSNSFGILANAVIMQVANTTPFVNGSEITITGVNGVSNTSLNSSVFYVKLANDYPSSGNTILFTTSDLANANAVALGSLSYTNSPNAIATSIISSGSGVGIPGGSTSTIQYNDSGTFGGSAGFTFNSITGDVAIPGNLAVTGNISGSLITGTLTTNAQPNVTSVGTLTTLTVSGNASAGNLNTAGTVTASRLISNVATGTAPLVVTSTTQVANLNVATAGTVTTAAQPNITSVGTLSSLAVTANITAGNVYANSGTVGANSVSVNANVSTGGIKTDNYYYANGTPISFAGTYGNSNVANYLPTFTGTVGATALTTGANTTAGTITGNWGLSTGSKLTATYADLAEYYEADAPYEPGTVVAFGGDKEVTIAEDGTTKVAGIVSTNPAYVMNGACVGEHVVALALQGRVPCKVRGNIKKGDMLISAGYGFARPAAFPVLGTVIGKSLENFDGIEGIIEVAVGRL